MADDTGKDENNEDEEDFGALTDGEDSDSDADDSGSLGMGSLPPLSDFDSGEEGTDSDLPPLDTPDADTGDDEGPISGLPPIVDIRVDTPAVRPSDLDTPTPSQPDAPQTPTPAGFDTPGDELDSPVSGGVGFQDFAADSDFSPETPEIGPGPDSDIETPMFDSAFGGDSDDFSTGGGTGTSAPTQAMDTPLFGSKPEGGGTGFDDDAFGMPTPDVGADAGTPVPDFSPDTGAGGPPDTGMPPMAAPPGKSGGRIGVLVVVLLCLLTAFIGFAASPFIVDKIPFFPNPQGTTIADQEGEITTYKTTVANLNRQLRDIQDLKEGQDAPSPEELDRLIREVSRVNSEFETKQAQLFELENSLVLVRADIEEKNGQFVDAQQALDDILNETVIKRAQYDGLNAENDRLTGVVAELEVANSRRQATKDTLLHNIDLLIVQVQGGSPLAPGRYDHGGRLAKVTALRDKVARAKWVDPPLLDQFTNLYLAELGIASSREYFFARIPVHDQLDNIRYIWAECLMNGNWSVYYQTIDGKHVGSYENAAGSGPPRYEFREELPGGMRADISEAIEASRVEDYEDKIAVLQQKQDIYDNKTKLQTSFSSL